MPSDIFKGIIGHEAAKRVLSLAIERPHGAYLLTGPEGVGAHTLAERFVRALAGGHEADRPLAAHPDIAVLARDLSAAADRSAAADESAAADKKTAKNVISVEAVRELRARLTRRPVIAPRVVAYLPEAERLNEEGQNALLKCMEEPGAGAVFVLVTRDESRLPDTIKSRAACLTLSRVPSSVIGAWLKSRGHGDADRRDALEIAEGRPGRALRWLEDLEFRDALESAKATVSRLLSSSSAGEAFAALDVEARRSDAADDVIAAWRDVLSRWSSALRSFFVSNPARALRLGQTLILAQRRLGGPIPPRIWFEFEFTKPNTT